MMAGEKIVDKSESIAPGSMSDSTVPLPEKEMDSRSESVSSVSAVTDTKTGIKGGNGQASAAGQGVYYPPTSFYDYCYPGYNGTFAQLDDKGYLNTAAGSYTGAQSDNSLLYYLPGYGPYTAGYMGVDGKQPYVSSGYLQQPAYGSEAFPYYAWDSTYNGNGMAASSIKSGNAKSGMGQNGSVKSSISNSVKTNGSLTSKGSTVPLNSKTRQSSTNFSRPVYQPLKPLNKLGSAYQPTGLIKGFHPVSKFSSYTNQIPDAFMHYPMNYPAQGRIWNNNYRFKPRENFSKNGGIEALTELTRGPRADNKGTVKSSAEVELVAPSVGRGNYNLEEFQTRYDNAKFYVIKSYSEDDVHKCIKYDVWSSTPNGNKKLDAAYRDADVKMTETGTKCPVFLFFSVNGSGQFVGIAEMIGQVDFNKNMDFWQLDKWNGFFPVKWHIIKDIPNTQLRHIILENNEDRPVTYSRDTQEIGLKQGLEMLDIFKSYSPKTSVLDDFNFYEEREKSIKAKRNVKPTTESDSLKVNNSSKQSNTQEGILGEVMTEAATTVPTAPLISLTQNLSLNSAPLKSSI